MDKRNIIFFVSLSIALLLINLYFGQIDQEKNQQWTVAQKAKKEEIKNKLETEVKSHAVKNEDLPIVQIFEDPESKISLGYALFVDQNVLSVMRKEPAKVFVDGKEYQLKKKKEHEGDVTLYSQGEPKNITTIDTPELGSFDLQLVFPNEKIVYAKLIDSNVIVPEAQLIKEFPEGEEKLPDENALVLIKTQKGYVPIGSYLPKVMELRAFEDQKGIASLLKVSDIYNREIAKKEEQFFVLENAYQQLVFSNVGGALVEINLPFQSKENTKSSVKEINYDREIIKDSPQEARFPIHAYFTPGQTPNGPYVKNKEGKLGGYYPLIRRDLIDSYTKKVTRVKPAFYSLNIVSDYPEVAELVYEVKHFDNQSIVFEATQSFRKITKTYSIANENEGAPYTLDLKINIEGDARGLWLTTGVPEVEWISGSMAPSLKYRITRNNQPAVEAIDLPKDSLTVSSTKPDWVANSNGFLGFIVDPLGEIDSGFKATKVSGVEVPSRLILIDEEYQLFNPADLPGYTLMMPLKSSGGTMNFRIFAGPFSDTVLKTVDATFSDKATGYNPDYIAAQTFHGWFSFISEPFAKFMLILLNAFYSFTHSWALSIILLTVALRVMMYPLNAWSTKSMLKMQQLAPELAAIQEKYKKDPKKLQMEMATLYRDKKVNPFSGCLPLVIQMPFLIGMFDLLKSNFELRGATFIPGWINDLAAPDVLFSWHYPIFFIGTEFHLLPILLGLVMFLQQRMSSAMPKKVSEMTDQQKQQRFMGNMMTVVFAIMFYHVPSGLNIYWLSSMLLGMGQQWWMQKRVASIGKASSSKSIDLKTL